MTPEDLAVRNVTYGQIRTLGRVPTSSEIAAVLGVTADEVRSAWSRLHDAHALVLDVGGGAIRMANPFSGVPTRFRVHADERLWYANCAWDAFGVCAALGVDGSIDTDCAECGESISCAVRDRRPDQPTLLFHCLVPASAWWDDIVFT